MSLSWPSELRLWLQPDRVTAERRPAPWQRGRPEVFDWPLPDAPSTTEALEVIRTHAGRLGKVVRVSVVLANSYARYTLMRPASTLNATEHAAYIEHKLKVQFGEAAMRWAYRTSPTGEGTAVLVAGLDRALVEGLRTALGPRGGVCASIQPAFATAFNALRQRLGRATGWFAMLEPGHVVLGRLHNGRWQSLASRHLRANSAEDLFTALDREQALQGVVEPCTEVYLVPAAAQAPLAIKPDAPYRVQVLAPPDAMSIPERHGHALAA